MSHDRGCYCGREKYEYQDCDRKDCDRRNKALMAKSVDATDLKSVEKSRDGSSPSERTTKFSEDYYKSIIKFQCKELDRLAKIIQELRSEKRK